MCVYITEKYITRVYCFVSLYYYYRNTVMFQCSQFIIVVFKRCWISLYVCQSVNPGITEPVHLIIVGSHLAKPIGECQTLASNYFFGLKGGDGLSPIPSVHIKILPAKNCMTCLICYYIPMKRLELEWVIGIELPSHPQRWPLQVIFEALYIAAKASYVMIFETKSVASVFLIINMPFFTAASLSHHFPHNENIFGTNCNLLLKSLWGQLE